MAGQIDDIFLQLKDIYRRLLNLETVPQPPNIELSETASASFTINSGQIVWASVILSEAAGKRLLGIPNVSIFKDTVDADGFYPSGANWSGSNLADLRYTTWIDWGSTDNNDIVLQMFFYNAGGSSLSLNIRANWRYLQKGATV